jgi:MYXO-CTERM domain-containing protein
VFGDVSAEERRLELEATTTRDIEENRAEIEFDRDAQQAPDGRSPIARLLTTTSFSNLDRLIGFSDGVYAIAITLLGFQFQPPQNIDSNGDLIGYLTGSYPPGDRGILPLYLSYVLSFLVIAAMWNLHHRYFLVIRAQDEAVRAINLAHLFFIVSLPFTTELMAVYGSVPAVAAIYAMNLGLAGLSLTVLWWYASHGHRLIDPSTDQDEIVWTRRLGLFMPVVFLSSIALTPWIGEQVWWVWVLGLVALGFLRRRERGNTVG